MDIARSIHILVVSIISSCTVSVFFVVALVGLNEAVGHSLLLTIYYRYSTSILIVVGT